MAIHFFIDLVSKVYLMDRRLSWKGWPSVTSFTASCRYSRSVFHHLEVLTFIPLPVQALYRSLEELAVSGQIPLELLPAIIHQYDLVLFTAPSSMTISRSLASWDVPTPSQKCLWMHTPDSLRDSLKRKVHKMITQEGEFPISPAEAAKSVNAAALLPHPCSSSGTTASWSTGTRTPTCAASTVSTENTAMCNVTVNICCDKGAFDEVLLINW